MNIKSTLILFPFFLLVPAFGNSLFRPFTLPGSISSVRGRRGVALVSDSEGNSSRRVMHGSHDSKPVPHRQGGKKEGEAAAGRVFFFLSLRIPEAKSNRMSIQHHSC